MYTFFIYVKRILLGNVGLWTFFTKEIAVGLLHEAHEGAARDSRPPFRSCFTHRETCTEKSPRFTKGMIMLSNESQIGKGCWTSKCTEADSYLRIKGSVTLSSSIC